MNKLLVRAKLAGRLLRFVPFARMVGLNGSLVRGEETPESDIDILIIAKSGRLYTTRFFATGLIGLSGWRRAGKRVSGRICLNCYLSDKNPSIFPENKKDISKVIRAYKYMIPLVDDGSLKIFFKKNRWFEQFEVNGEEHSQVLRELIFTKFPLKPRNRFIEKVLSAKFGDFLEQKLMNYQIKRIFAGKKKNDHIYADKFAIKLHPKKS